MTLTTDWKNLLIDAEIARNYHWIMGDHRLLSIPLVDSIIVSGLLIRAISLLDDALDNFISDERIPVPDKNPRLYHRLRTLDLEKRLSDFEDIDHWRQRRNDVGHEVSETYTWDELERCLSAIFRELNHIELLTVFHRFEVRKTIQRVPQSNHRLSQQVLLEVIEGDEIIKSFQWRVRSGS